MKKVLYLLIYMFSALAIAEEECLPENKAIGEITTVLGSTSYDQSVCKAIDVCMEYPLRGKSDCKKLDMFYQISNRARSDNKSGHCGLTPTELATLAFYTASGYGCLNQYLRDPSKPDKNMERTVQILNKALMKMPAYHGYVKRGTTLSQKDRLLHAKGNIVEYKAFTSTSTSATGAFSRYDMFFIYSRTGRPIMGFSGLTYEKEVLFPAGTKFKVLDTFQDGQKNYYILKEIFPLVRQDLEPRMDEVMLNLYKLKNKKSNKSDDKWVCPTDNKKPTEQYIIQQHFPAG